MRKLFIHEVAKIARVPEATVRWWIQSGKLPSTRPGRRRMVDSKDLAAFLNNTQRKGGPVAHGEHS